jgi:hypothetical protein
MVGIEFKDDKCNLKLITHLYFPRKTFYFGALFGLLLPFGIVYLRLQLDTKIHAEEDLRSQINDFFRERLRYNPMKSYWILQVHVPPYQKQPALV